MKYYTWDEIYERAEDKPCGSDELNAKDEARFQANNYAMEKGYEDAEEAEIPEERIEYYCDYLGLMFDEDGNINAIGVTNINFFNPDNGNMNETQFDTLDEEELKEMWWEFCKENNLIKLNKGIADYSTGEMI